MLDFSAKAYRNSTLLTQTRTNFSPFEPIGSRRSFDLVTTGFDVFNTSRFNFGGTALGATTLAVTYGGDGFEDAGRHAGAIGNIEQRHLRLGFVE